MRHLIEPLDLTTDEFEFIFRLADDIILDPSKYLDRAKGKLLASLFLSHRQEQGYLLKQLC